MVIKVYSPLLTPDIPIFGNIFGDSENIFDESKIIFGESENIFGDNIFGPPLLTAHCPLSLARHSTPTSFHPPHQ